MALYAASSLAPYANMPLSPLSEIDSILLIGAEMISSASRICASHLWYDLVDLDAVLALFPAANAALRYSLLPSIPFLGSIHRVYTAIRIEQRRRSLHDDHDPPEIGDFSPATFP